MSWQNFVDDELVGKSGGDCDQGAIIGKSGADWSIWAYTANPAFNLTPKEINDLCKGMELDVAGMEAYFAPTGIRVAGIKYQFLRVMEDSNNANMVLGKCKDHGNIAIQKNKTCVAIAHTTEGKPPGNVNKVLGALCSYLVDVGF